MFITMVVLSVAPAWAWVTLVLALLEALLVVFLLWVLHERGDRVVAATDEAALADVKSRHTRKYDFATVLFADIQGFTKIAEHTDPEQLVDELDRYFIYFDETVDRYGVEKIKTIGDAYMCAGGVPDADSANPIEVVLVGLDIMAYVQERRASAEGFWNIRVGINTGPVISGHLGNIKKVFDIWGDSVNTASRMESGSEPGRVNISGSTYAKILDYFDCTYRGKMPVKYKGEIDMYFVDGLKPEYRLEGLSYRPNALLMRKLQMLRLGDFEQLVRDQMLQGMHLNLGRRMDRLIIRVRTLSQMEQLSDDEASAARVSAVYCFIQEEFPDIKLTRSVVQDRLRKLHLSEEVKGDIVRIMQRTEQGKAPLSRAEQVVSDAFNEVYGRKDIIALLLANYEDIVARGSKMTRTAWLTRQRQAVAEVVFHTNAARLLVEAPKERQSEILEQAIKLL